MADGSAFDAVDGLLAGRAGPLPLLVGDEGSEQMLLVANLSEGEGASWGAGIQALASVAMGDQLAFRVAVANRNRGSAANDTVVRVLFPVGASCRHDVLANARARGSANPEDALTVRTAAPARLKYLPGSTRLWKGARDPEGTHLPDGIAAPEGVDIGTVFGSSQGRAQVTFRAVVVPPTAVASAVFVAPVGAERWGTIAQDVREGAALGWKIRLRNTSSTTLRDVKVRARLSDDVQYWTGTTVFYGPHTPRNGYAMADGVAANGLVVEELAPGLENAVSIVFQTVIREDLLYGPHGVAEIVTWAETYSEPNLDMSMAKATVAHAAAP